MKQTFKCWMGGALMTLLYLGSFAQEKNPAAPKWHSEKGIQDSLEQPPKGPKYEMPSDSILALFGKYEWMLLHVNCNKITLCIDSMSIITG